MERLRHLPVKTSSSDQGVRPHGVTRHAGHARTKKKAARRSSGRKKVLQRSLHHCIKTARRLRWRRMSAKTRLHLHDGLP